MWISNFLIPDSKVWKIRPSTFLLVAKLAMGIWLALAPATLAYMFCRLQEITTSKEPGYSPVALPLLLHRFGTLFQEVASNKVKNYLPGLVFIANALPIDIGAFEARKIFMRMEKSRYTLNHRPSRRCLPTMKTMTNTGLMGRSYNNSNLIFWRFVCIVPSGCP